MKIALLGADDDALALVRWAIDHEDAELIAAYEAQHAAGPLRGIAPGVALRDDWESLLAAGPDLVIVSAAPMDGDQPDGVADDERRADQLRKLMQEEAPLLVVHPACDTLLAYEIDLACREGGRIVVPYLPGYQHPLFERLAERIAGQTVEQILFERSLPHRDRASVLRQFTRDLPLLRSLLGGVQKLAATGPVTEAMVDPLGPKRKERHSLANLLVNLSGPAPFTARWSVAPVVDEPGGRLIVIGSEGRALLTMPHRGAWSLRIDGDSPQEFIARDDEQLAAAWRTVRQAVDRSQPVAVWSSLCHDFDAVGSIDRSIQRGRTVELLADSQSEEDNFKGVMAVGGCLTLTAVLLVLLLAAVVEGLQLPIRDSVAWRFWPMYLLGPIVLFLGLQLLGLFARPNHPHPSAADTGPGKSPSKQEG